MLRVREESGPAAILSYRSGGSLGLMKHPAFGRVFGGIGLILGAGGLALNIWTFPTPPINVGLPDVGPFAVTWYGILFILMIRASRKMT